MKEEISKTVYWKPLIDNTLLPGGCEYGPGLVPGYGGGASGYPELGGGALASLALSIINLYFIFLV